MALKETPGAERQKLNTHGSYMTRERFPIWARGARMESG